MKVRIAGLITLIAVTFIATGCFDDLVIEGIVRSDPEPPINPAGVLAFPGENATEEEKERHGQVAIAAAVNVNLLDISGCTPKPLVIEVGYGESIEIKNSDTVSHILYHGEGRITVPAHGTRGIVVSDFVGIRGGDGVAGYACDDVLAGIFYINSRLERHISFRVVEFLFPDGSSGPGLEGVRVTLLEGSAEVKETIADGIVTFRGNPLPLTVRLEKEGYINTEVTVSEEGEKIVLPTGRQSPITFRVVEPLILDKNGPGVEAVSVTCLEGSDERIKETAADGSVTFFGIPPLTVRLEKPGYITTEAMVGRKSEVVFPNQWPEKAAESIRQLGLTEMIASGELILRWGEDEYLPARSKELAKQPGEDGLGAIIKSSCSPNRVIIVVRKWRGRESMVAGVVHELMHARQGYDANPPLCGDWKISKEGKAWIAATEKDLEETGPIPDFDDQIYGVSGILLGEFPSENQAMFYSRWYMGPGDGRLIEALGGDRERDLKMLYEFAPNRYQYLEDRFGPPPR